MNTLERNSFNASRKEIKEASIQTLELIKTDRQIQEKPKT